MTRNLNEIVLEFGFYARGEETERTGGSYWFALARYNDDLFSEKSVVDPHHVDADPGADPDSTQHSDSDPDSDFYLMRIRIRLITLMRIQILASK
jgi:hypothetical protein